jgi:DNA-binding beta-propeller fold protein YncE
VYGTIAKPWMEYLVEAVRRQATLAGAPLPAVEAMVRDQATLSHYLVLEGLDADAVRQRRPDLANALAQHYPDGRTFSGLAFPFWRQLAARRLAEAWAAVDAPVLAMHGESDFVGRAADPELIAAIVDQAHPGRATFVTIPASDHNFRRYPTMQASLQGPRPAARAAQPGGARAAPRLARHARHHGRPYTAASRTRPSRMPRPSRLPAAALLVALTGCAAANTAPAPRPAPDRRRAARHDRRRQPAVGERHARHPPGGATRHVTVGTGPHEAAVSPDGRWGVVTVYGTREETGTRLALVDLAAGTLVRHVPLGAYTRPHGVVVLPGGRRAVVTSEASQRLLLVDLDRDSVVAAVPTGAAGSHMVAVTRDGTRAWTANVGAGSVSEIDLVAARLVRQIPTAPVTEGIAVTPDGAEVWAGSNQARTITVVDTRTGRSVATVGGVGVPYRIAIAPDGRTAAVADPEGNAVHLVDVAARRVVGAVTGIGSPRGVSFAPDGRTAFATLGPEGAVAVLDVAARAVRGRHPVGASPDGVAFAPATR